MSETTYSTMTIRETHPVWFSIVVALCVGLASLLIIEAMKYEVIWTVR
jgi:hypothetical protein